MRTRTLLCFVVLLSVCLAAGISIATSWDDTLTPEFGNNYTEYVVAGNAGQCYGYGLIDCDTDCPSYGEIHHQILIYEGGAIFLLADDMAEEDVIDDSQLCSLFTSATLSFHMNDVENAEFTGSSYFLFQLPAE